MVRLKQLVSWAIPVLLALITGLASFSVQVANARPVWLDESVSEYKEALVTFEALDSIDSGATMFGGQRYSARAKQVQLGDRAYFASLLFIVSAPESTELETAAKYQCLIRLSPTEDFSKFSFRGKCIDKIRLVQKAPAPVASVSLVREAFLRNLTGVSSDSTGLVAGLAIGETNGLGSAFTEDMRAIGLTHLTAVSGANCAIVVGLVYLVAVKITSRRWVRTGLGLSALLGYVALVGPEPSVLRSAFMSAVVLLAVALGRPSAGLSALALSVLVLLCADPWLATDFGFMLSVAATGGILLLTPTLTQRLRPYLPAWLALPLAVSLAAQLLCLPVLLQLQSGLATYSLLANVLVEPMVAPITVLGICACLVALPFPWLAGVLSWLASVAAEWIVLITRWLAGAPGGVIPWPTGAPGILASLAVIAIVMAALLGKSIKIRNLGALGLAVAIATTLGSSGSFIQKYESWPAVSWQITACDVGQGDSIVLHSEGKTAVIDVGRMPEDVDQCLTRLGITRIDLLVLTHFDMDHVGGLSGAISGRTVHEALLSPFVDERWAAANTQESLLQAGAKLFWPWAGQSGVLGEFEWLVLNPSNVGAAATDSNDASLAMIWSHPMFNLLTLADLGEPGQMRVGAASSQWLGRGLDNVPMVLKVAHHGSRDQFAELTEAVRPDICLISVGAANSYGHPAKRTLDSLNSTGCRTLRTDQLGSISLDLSGKDVKVSASGRG